MPVILILLTAVCFFTGSDTDKQPVRDFLRFCGISVLGLLVIGYLIAAVFRLL
jgi:hypothetical protein